MIPDVQPPAGVWFNLRTVPGIAADARLLIQSKSGRKTLVWEGESPPGVVDGDDLHGFEIYLGSFPVRTGAGPTGCWVYCFGDLYTTKGRLCVQVYQP